MKQTNSAITFLMAQYRAIYKNAYLKGLVSALVLTAGMGVASQASAENELTDLNTITNGKNVSIESDGSVDGDSVYSALNVTQAATSFSGTVTIKTGVPGTTATTNNYIKANKEAIKINDNNTGTIIIHDKSAATAGLLISGGTATGASVTVNLDTMGIKKGVLKVSGGSAENSTAILNAKAVNVGVAESANADEAKLQITNGTVSGTKITVGKGTIVLGAGAVVTGGELVLNDSAGGGAAANSVLATVAGAKGENAANLNLAKATVTKGTVNVIADTELNLTTSDAQGLKVVDGEISLAGSLTASKIELASSGEDDSGAKITASGKAGVLNVGELKLTKGHIALADDTQLTINQTEGKAISLDSGEIKLASGSVLTFGNDLELAGVAVKVNDGTDTSTIKANNINIADDLTLGAANQLKNIHLAAGSENNAGEISFAEGKKLTLGKAKLTIAEGTLNISGATTETIDFGSDGATITIGATKSAAIEGSSEELNNILSSESAKVTLAATGQLVLTDSEPVNIKDIPLANAADDTPNKLGVTAEATVSANSLIADSVSSFPSNKVNFKSDNLTVKSDLSTLSSTFTVNKKLSIDGDSKVKDLTLGDLVDTSTIDGYKDMTSGQKVDALLGKEEHQISKVEEATDGTLTVTSGGTLTVQNGRWTADANITLGEKGGSKTGTLNIGVNSSSSQKENAAVVKVASDSTLKLVDGAINVGDSNASNLSAVLDLREGKWDLSGPTAAASGAITVAARGELILNQENAAQLTTTKATTNIAGKAIISGSITFDSSKIVNNATTDGQIGLTGNLEVTDALTLSGTALNITSDTTSSIKADSIYFKDGGNGFTVTKANNLEAATTIKSDGNLTITAGTVKLTGAETASLEVGGKGTIANAGTLSLNATSGGSITATSINNTGTLTIGQGAWDAQNISIEGAGKLNVGTDATTTASLNAKKLNLAGETKVYEKSSLTLKEIAGDGSKLVVNGVVRVNGTNTGSGASDPQLGDAGYMGFDLTGGAVTVDGANARFEFGDVALDAIYTINGATEGGNADKFGNFGQYDLKNGGTLSMDFAKSNSEYTLSLGKLATIKKTFITTYDETTGSIKGGYIDIGSTKIDGISQIINSGDSTVAWGDYQTVQDTVGGFVNEELGSVTIKDVNTSNGTSFTGSVGSVELAKSETNLKVTGSTSLSTPNANGFFVAVNGGKESGNVTVESGSFKLTGKGTIANVTLTGVEGGKTNFILDGDISVGSVNKASQRSGTAVQVAQGANVTFSTGGKLTVDELTNQGAISVDNAELGNLKAYADSQLTAKSLKFTNPSGENNIAGSISAESVTASHGVNILGGSLTASKSFTVTDLQVGYDSLEEKQVENDVFDPTKDYAGIVDVGALSFSDQINAVGSFSNGPSIIAANFLGTEKEQATNNDKNFVGALKQNTSVIVGNNSIVSFGASAAEAQAVINSLGGLGKGEDQVATALYINGRLDASKSHSISLSTINDIDRLGYRGAQNDLYLGDNTVLILNGDALSPQDTKPAITLADTATVQSDGGYINIIGNVKAATYKIFNDGITVIPQDGEEGILVSTANGFLEGFITNNGATSNGTVKFGITDDAHLAVNKASSAVFSTLKAYAQGYNGDGEQATTSTVIGTLKDKGGKIASKAAAEGSTPTPTDLVDTANYQYENSFLAASISGNGQGAEHTSRFGVYAGAAQAALLAGNTTSDAISSRMGMGAANGNATFADNGQGSALWVTPVYKTQDSDGFNGQGTNYGVDTDLYGVALGGDFTLANGVRIGAMFNVGSGDAEGNGFAQGIKNDFDYYGFGIYAGYSFDKFSLVGDVTYSVVDNDVQSNNEIEKVTAKFDSKALSLGVTAQYAISFNGLDVTPHAALRYTSVDMQDFSVKGTKEIAYYDSDKINVFSIPVGVTFSKDMLMGEWTVKPTFDLTLTANVGDDEADSSVKWVDNINGGSINNLVTKTKSEILDNFTYGATAGIAAKTGNFSLGLGVNYTGSSNTSGYGISANARFVF